jgi:hypothetical protein
MRDLASLCFLNRHTFVCGTLFGRINLDYLHPPKQSSTYKSAILADLLGEAKSPTLLTLFMVISCESLIKNIILFILVYCMQRFEIVFKICVKFPFQWACSNVKITIFEENCYSAAHKYNTSAPIRPGPGTRTPRNSVFWVYNI